MQLNKENNLENKLPTTTISLATLILIPLITFLFLGVSLTFEYPVLKQLSPTVFTYARWC